MLWILDIGIGLGCFFVVFLEEIFVGFVIGIDVFLSVVVVVWDNLNLLGYKD